MRVCVCVCAWGKVKWLHCGPSHSIDTPQIQTNIQLDSIKYDFDWEGGEEATGRRRSNNGCIGRSLCCVRLNLSVSVYAMERERDDDDDDDENETKKKRLHKSHYSKMFHREISWKDNKKRPAQIKRRTKKECDRIANQKIVCVEIIWLVQQIKK